MSSSKITLFVIVMLCLSFCSLWINWENFVSQKNKSHQHFEREVKVFHRTGVKLAQFNTCKSMMTHSKKIVFFTRQLFCFFQSLSFHHIKISNLFSSTFLHSLRLINKICGMIMCIPFTIILIWCVSMPDF